MKISRTVGMSNDFLRRWHQRQMVGGEDDKDAKMWKYAYWKYPNSVPVSWHQKWSLCCNIVMHASSFAPPSSHSLHIVKYQFGKSNQKIFVWECTEQFL